MQLDKAGSQIAQLEDELSVARAATLTAYEFVKPPVTHDIQRVSLESGNSPKVIQREYLELATESDGRRWFEIMPPANVAATAPQSKQPVVARKPRRSSRT